MKEFFKKNLIKIIIIIVAIVIIVGLIVTFIPRGTEKNAGLSEKKYAVTETATKQINLVDYENENITMKVPEGWNVTTGGTEMYYTISIQDPNDERNQIFAVLKAGVFLKSNEAKKWHKSYVDLTKNQTYRLFSEAVILNPPTVENFYSNFNNYAEYVKKFEPTYTNFTFPFLSVFENVEEFESNTYIKNLSCDDKTIRATFEDSQGRPGEGLFMGSVVDMGNVYAGNIDTCFYSLYNVMFITSAKDEFINYESILAESLSTLSYKQSFVDYTNSNIKERTDAALKANATVQSAFNSYNNAWLSRQKTYDITSQKYSDATLGYERVYDTETGEVYKAYNGFTDDYKGERYQTITDDMYTNSVSGYIQKVD